jgi:hypothetical protein
LSAGEPAIDQGQHATSDHQKVRGRHPDSPHK